MPSFSEDDQFLQAPDALSTDSCGQKIIMNINDGKYYVCNDTASVIWGLLSAPRSIKQISAQLVKNYDITNEECTRSVEMFVSQFLDNGLIMSANR